MADGSCGSLWDREYWKLAVKKEGRSLDAAR